MGGYGYTPKTPDRVKRRHMRKIWNAWIEDNGSLVFCTGDNPLRYFRILPWDQQLNWSVVKVTRFLKPGQLTEWKRLSGNIDVDFLNNPWVTQRNGSVNRFISDIPVKIRETLKGYRCCQFLMLRLVASIPAAKDLLESNPVLLWLLTYRQHVLKYSQRQIEDMLHLKQHVLLSKILGGTHGKRVVHFLRKLEVEEADLSLIELLHSLLVDTDRLALFAHHWMKIPQGALEPVMRYNSAGFSRCLATELAAIDKGRYSVMISEICSLWDELERQAMDFGNTDEERRTLCRLGSLRGMHELHHQWIRRTYDKKYHGELADQARNMPPFPDPPFSGNETIRHLCTPLELYFEGRDQSQCVYSRRDLASSDERAYYAIFHPERGTFELEHRGGRWVLREFKLDHNRPPSSKSIDYVNDWLLKEQSRVHINSGNEHKEAVCEQIESLVMA